MEHWGPVPVYRESKWYCHCTETTEDKLDAIRAEVNHKMGPRNRWTSTASKFSSLDHTIVRLVYLGWGFGSDEEVVRQTHGRFTTQEIHEYVHHYC